MLHILQALLRLCTLRDFEVTINWKLSVRKNIAYTEVDKVAGWALTTSYNKGTVIKIKLRALALSILNLNYTLEIALHINNQLKN